MDDKRNLIIAGVVFTALLAFVLATQTGDRGLSTVELPDAGMPAADALERVTIERPDRTVVLARDRETWRIASPLSFPAAARKVERLATRIEAFQPTDLIDEGAGAGADYGLNTPTALALRVEGGGTTRTVWIGSPNESHTHTFVRLEPEGPVYQVLGDLRAQLDVPAEDWRSLQITDFSPDALIEVRLEREQGSDWRIVKEKVEEPVPAAEGSTATSTRVRMAWRADGEAMNEGVVNQYLNNLARLRAAAIAEEEVSDTARIAMVSYRTQTENGVLHLYAQDPETKQYRVRHGEGDTVYRIHEYQGKNFLKDLDTMRLNQ